MILRTAYLLLFLISIPETINAADTTVVSSMEMADNRAWPHALEAARTAGNPALEKLIQWRYMLDTDSGAGFSEIRQFISENPEWPELKRLNIRAEFSLRDNPVENQLLIDAFKNTPPVTGIGCMALARALADNRGEKEQIRTLVHDGWIKGDFTEAEEKDLLEKFSNYLGKDEHIARADRLLWEEKITAAERMFPLVPFEHRELFEARIALIRNKKNANSLIGKVNKELKQDAGLIYERMRWRARRGDREGVRQMLFAAPENPPYPEKWWWHREYEAREAIHAKDYKTAAKLVKGYPEEMEATALANALWMDGWVRLEFNRESKEAYTIFTRMYETVKYPVSRARAAYWAARAANRHNDSEAATRWFKTAAEHPTTFYGQLAHWQVYGERALSLPAEPSSGPSGINADLLSAIHLLIEAEAYDLASKFINHIAEEAIDDDHAVYIASLGHKAKLPHLSVRAAKKVLQRNIILKDTGYPLPQMPIDLPIERALTLGITRQESEFNPEGRSPAGALGLMQLLPSTAREMARKLGMPYSKALLISPEYNYTLGSYYLSRLIGAYDGSYILAIAAYNAGPGNVSKWMREFGGPGSSLESAIDWIEKIPFAETRNYVQRVLENTQIYRHIESDGSVGVSLQKDLTR